MKARKAGGKRTTKLNLTSKEYNELDNVQLCETQSERCKLKSGRKKLEKIWKSQDEEEVKRWRLTGGLIEGAADAGSSDIDRTAFKMETDR